MKQQKEQPIRLYIYRFLSDKYAPSHAALEYKGNSIDYSSKGFSENGDSGQHGCYVYEIYPSDIGVDPKKLEQAIQKRQKQIQGSDYQYFTENCADQVLAVLKEAGAKNLPNQTGLGLSIPSMEGTIPKIVKSSLMLTPAAPFIANQQTIEDYCKKYGHKAEMRKNEKDYYDIQSKFSTYMKILNNPKEFKKDMQRRCRLELQGKNPDGDENMLSGLLKDYEKTLSPEDVEKYKKQYAALINITPPTAEEKAKIKAKYEALIAQANLPPERIRQQALSLFFSCGENELLRDRLIDLANKYAPTIALEYKAKAEKMVNNLPVSLGGDRPTDSKIKSARPKSPTKINTATNTRC